MLPFAAFALMTAIDQTRSLQTLNVSSCQNLSLALVRSRQAATRFFPVICRTNRRPKSAVRPGGGAGAEMVGCLGRCFVGCLTPKENQNGERLY